MLWPKIVTIKIYFHFANLAFRVKEIAVSQSRVDTSNSTIVPPGDQRREDTRPPARRFSFLPLEHISTSSGHLVINVGNRWAGSHVTDAGTNKVASPSAV